MDSPNTGPDAQALFLRIQAGDMVARNQFLTLVYDRVIRLTAAILKGFPIVRQRHEVESVANELSLKLIATLDERLKSQTVDEFLRFAGIMLRHHLIDQAAKYRRRGDMLPIAVSGGDSRPDLDPGTVSHDPAPLAILTEDWAALLERIEGLPDDERFVVEQRLLWDTTQARIAQVKGWTPKQVSRMWLSALKKLLPEDGAQSSERE